MKRNAECAFGKWGLLRQLTANTFTILILSGFMLGFLAFNSQAQEPLCSNVIGEWQWDNYGTVYIYPDGTTEHVEGGEILNTGKWICDIDLLKIEWTVSGWSDRLTIKDHGAKLEGYNQQNMKITATRVGDSGFHTNCGLAVGTWQWDSYGIVDILADMTTQHIQGGVVQNTGKWACENGKVTIRWTKGGSTDRLIIKRDGNALVGQNRAGVPIKATRM